jgi:hypothetical protein
MPNSQSPAPESVLDSIPDPDTVRDWLAGSIRQSALLRSLLRLAERKDKLSRVTGSPTCRHDRPEVARGR